MPRRIRAAIFDFDGLLADTEELHFLTLTEVLQREGIPLTRTQNNEGYIGLDVVRSFQKAFHDAGRSLSSADLQRVLRLKGELFAAGLDRVKLFPGIKELLAAASERYPCALATGSCLADIRPVLERHGLQKTFLTCVTADDGFPSKPAPDIFLEACRRLGESQRRAPPAKGPASVPAARECLVVEDSVPGILAAKRASMTCVALAHSHPVNRLQKADVVFESALDWDWERVTR